MATNPTSALGMQNWFSTTLSAPCGSTDTTISLNALPSETEGYLVIDPNGSREVIHYTSLGTGDVILPGTGDRGLDGTTAQSHLQGVLVVMYFTTSYWTALQTGNALAANLGKTTLELNGNPVWQYLGYAQITSPYTQTGGGTSFVTGLSVNVTIPTGATKTRITAYSGFVKNSTSTQQASMYIYSGATSGALTTQLQEGDFIPSGNNYGTPMTLISVIPAVSGSIYFSVALYAQADNAIMSASSIQPAFILVECC